jgi:hypothetical protein
MAMAEASREIEVLLEDGSSDLAAASDPVPSQAKSHTFAPLAKKFLATALVSCGVLALVVCLGLARTSTTGIAEADDDFISLKLKTASVQLNEQSFLRKCTAGQDNCLETGCCEASGQQCFAKTATYGMCRYKCEPAQIKSATGEDWSCDPIGIRYTPDYKDDYTTDYDKQVLAEPWVKKCSHIGDSCAVTKCCSYSGYYCFEKDAQWSSCLADCIPGKENGDEHNVPGVQPGKPEKNPPPHWNVTFKKAPPGPWTCKLKTVPPTPAKLDGASLFCFTFLSNNYGKKQTEDFRILAFAQKEHSHVFACDHWAVFSDVDAPLSPGATTKVEYPKELKRPNAKIWVNTPLFINIWKSIKNEGAYKAYAWTVKADPTAVFIPIRLQYILVHQPVTEAGVYLENCKHSRMSFHGSLEVVSRNAMSVFLDNLDKCQTELPYKNGSYSHFKYYGEDKFMAWCMHYHGVLRIPSRQEAIRVPMTEPIEGLHIASSCSAHHIPQTASKPTKADKKSGCAEKWTPDCKRIRTAGIHIFKKLKDYMKCYKDTTAKDTTPQLTA